VVLSYVAVDLAHCGKLDAFGLLHILSRDLRPARPATVCRHKARMYTLMAVHGCLDCYAYLPCEAKFR